MLLLPAKEGAFERLTATMGRWQLPRRAQLRVGDAHRFRFPYHGGAREQRPQPFVAEALAFCSCLSGDQASPLPGRQSVLN
jgi:hypothetical protein